MKYLSMIIFSIILLVTSACTPDANEELIQGRWSVVNESGGGSSSSAIRFLEWEFMNGYFFRQQEIDPLNVIQSEGKYRIIESEEDVIILELFDIKGERITYGNAPAEIKIEIDRDQDTIRVANLLFERVVP